MTPYATIDPIVSKQGRKEGGGEDEYGQKQDRVRIRQYGLRLNSHQCHYSNHLGSYGHTHGTAHHPIGPNSATDHYAPPVFHFVQCHVFEVRIPGFRGVQLALVGQDVGTDSDSRPVTPKHNEPIGQHLTTETKERTKERTRESPARPVKDEKWKDSDAISERVMVISIVPISERYMDTQQLLVRSKQGTSYTYQLVRGIWLGDKLYLQGGASTMQTC